MKKVSRASNEVRPEDPDNQSQGVPRSAFLAWLGVGATALAGAASGFVYELATSVAGLAARRQALSIGSGVPIVSRTGLFLGSVKTLQPNQALAYTDPKSGDPAILIRLAGGKLVSYDMLCPHQGCTVPYDPARQRLVCPCHGAQFDPAHGAAPLSGPVSQPLLTLPIRVDASGNVYALDAHPGSKVNRLHAPPAPSSGGDDGNEVNDDQSGNQTRQKRRKGGDD
jgi:thiosulfate dehydrogenase [quinone] large subunit